MALDSRHEIAVTGAVLRPPAALRPLCGRRCRTLPETAASSSLSELASRQAARRKTASETGLESDKTIPVGPRWSDEKSESKPATGVFRLRRIRWFCLRSLPVWSPANSYALRCWLPVAAVRVLPRLRGLLSLLALLSGVQAVRGGARLVPLFLPVLLLVVTALAVARLRGRLLPASLAPLLLWLARRRVKRLSRLKAGDGPLLDTHVDQALDRGEQRPVFAAHQRHRLAR